MYPNLGSGTTQPSAPPAPPSSTLSNSSAPQSVGFSSLMAQPNNQSTPYPSGQSSQPPYPTGPPYSSANQPPPPPPQNAGNYSPYSLPQVGNTPRPPVANSAYPQNPYPQQTNPSAGYPPGQQQPPAGYQSPYPPANPYQQQQQQQPQQGLGNAASQSPYPPSNPYQQQQPQQGLGNAASQSPYPPANPYQQQGSGNAANQNPYRSTNPYGSPQSGNTGNQNPYQPQQGGYPQQPPPYNPQQQQSYSNPYGANPQQPPGGYGGYPPYNQQQQPFRDPYAQQPPAGGYNANSYGAPVANDRIRSIAGRYEINDALAQRLNILQQFEIVVLCDDSGSMNTPVDGTNGTRWDELRSIVQIVIEIGTVFDSNGVDVHFLNRPPMPNVTDSRQVIESFSQRPGGLTPLTAALRRIFQSSASKPGSDKRLLVFVATDGAPTDASGNVDIRGLENLMRNERQANTTYVTFLACTDDESSVEYLSQWDRTMMNVDVVDDYKTEREEVRRNKGHNYPFSFGDYVAKALIGAVDPQMDLMDESGNNNNFRRF